MTGTYPQPRHGWTCFHCGENFTTPGGAAQHFGARPDATPGCIVKAHGSKLAMMLVRPGRERGLLQALRDAEAEVQRLHDRVETAEYQAGGGERLRADLERHFGAGHGTAHQAWLQMDAMEGRAEAAELALAWIARSQPDLVAAAREAICKTEAA